MRIALLVTVLALAAWPAAAKTPKACRACAAACADDVTSCADAAAAACPGAPRGTAKRCLKKARRRCKKDVKLACVAACKETGAPVCAAASSTTSTTIAGGGGNPCFTDGGDGTVHDSCTGLQWEKKTGSRGVHPPGALHDINDVYPWAGTCAHDASQLCQPNEAAAATCAAHADGGTESPPVGCTLCPGGDYDPSTNPAGKGPCTPAGNSGATTVMTVWVWLNQLNTNSFAGHDDWRLPSQAGRNTCPVSDPNCDTAAPPLELETIARGERSSCTPPCIWPIFGVPVELQTWSSSTHRSDQRYAWSFDFFTLTNERVTKTDTAVSVRAVRTMQ
jgi:hypothetical protein